MIIDFEKIRNIFDDDILMLLEYFYGEGVFDGGSEAYDFQDALKYSKIIKD